MTYTLLLADDSVTIQRVIELTFAEEDVKVITVGDGQAAIDRVEADPPDIILADVDMPKRDGYEVAAYVKSRPKLAHIPVVLLTGAFEPIDQARAAAAGSSDVLAKPFEPQMVINRVKQLLGKKRDDEPEMQAPESFAPPQAMRSPAAPRPPSRNPTLPEDNTSGQAPASETAGQPVSLDDYFNWLDAAFSNLQPGAAAGQQEMMPAEEDWMAEQDLQPSGPLMTPPPGPAPVNPEWAEPAPRPVPPPQAVAKPAPPVVVPPPPPAVAPPQAAASPRPVVPPRPVAPPPVPPAPAPPARPAANPFAELSAAKAEAAARPPAPVITDDVIEEVVSRVLQRLTDRVVRETVTKIVSDTAERLVQEEILRIKTEGQ